ncbi:lipopolysaccharide biosynthesis protein RfbH [Patescibacteria group bacterium]|nr:lipopolysaccharide biosynthesis protein RfbH [Patescibacteria group bacterium]MBU1931925.1 lipopolysaccharide biosynthesis protein RfbH [Patescibacteria group bacterium]
MDKQLEKLIKKIYQQKFPKKKFVPGQTYIPASGKVFNDKELYYLVQACLDGWWTEGRFNAKFEQKLAEKLGVNFCMTTNSGSSANLLALSALTSLRLKERRLKPGDEVITCAAGFPTTINPIIQHQLTPVFVDVNLTTLAVNIVDLEKAITKKTRAIFIAHTLGNPFNLNQVVRLAKKHRLWLIEDNCDALGAKYQNKYTGTFGDLATLSFYPAHHITMGEGGAVLTNNPLLTKIVHSIRDWGRDCWCRTGQDNTCGCRFSMQLGKLPFGYDHKYIYSEIGYNLKITDMQAALGLAQLGKLDRFIKIRQQNFDYLYSKLAELKDYFIFPQAEKHSEPSWFGFPLTLKPNLKFKRHELLQFLEANKIGTRLVFGGNITKQPYFVNYKINYRQVGKLANTDTIMNNSFWLGIYPGISKTMLNYVIATLNKFLEKHG